MNLLIISHKETWRDPHSPSGYATVGGFPFQVRAIAELFDSTTLMTPLYTTPLPAGALPITAHNLQLIPLTKPKGSGWQRKIAMLWWSARHAPILWREMRRADALHAPVPGDIGGIAILLALALRKPLFVRHCGTWRAPRSLADRLLFWLLEHIAGGKNVVLATGGAAQPPSARNPHIQWIFSTSLTRAELEALPSARPWSPSQPLRLVMVGRLSQSKNIQAIVCALPAVRAHYPQITLDIVGEGEYRSTLEQIVTELGLQTYITFHGNLSHSAVLQALSNSHLFVFPSLREGFPKAVLEALACGLPVIASDVSVLPHLLASCGVILPVPDAQHVAAAVLELLKDPLRWQAMSDQARQTARNYTLEAWGEQIALHLQAAWQTELRSAA